jgi:hypothetical protein
VGLAGPESRPYLPNHVFPRRFSTCDSRCPGICKKLAVSPDRRPISGLPWRLVARRKWCGAVFRPGHDAKLPPDPRFARGILRRRASDGYTGSGRRDPPKPPAAMRRADDRSGASADEDCPRGLPTSAGVAPSGARREPVGPAPPGCGRGGRACRGGGDREARCEARRRPDPSAAWPSWVRR